MSAPKVAVLAVQGAFAEHEDVLRRLGCEVSELRCAADARGSFDGLVLPGGESTVQAKLLHELGMFDALRGLIGAGLPVLGTCAGLILLACEVRGAHAQQARWPGFATLPVAVQRNAYGRQLGSFSAEAAPEPALVRLAAEVGAPDAPGAAAAPLPMRFIRAPRIASVGEGVDVLASMDGQPVCVRFRNQIGCAFHPELTDDDRIHRIFLRSVRGQLV